MGITGGMAEGWFDGTSLAPSGYDPGNPFDPASPPAENAVP